MVVEHLGVCLLLLCREAEQRLDDVELLLARRLRGKIVAASRLALAREGAHQIGLGFAGLEIRAHKNTPFRRWLERSFIVQIRTRHEFV